MKKVSSILKKSDKEVMKIVRQLQVAYKLKRTLRYATKRDLNQHNESVAEHVFALFFLAQYFVAHEDLSSKFNTEKLHQILLFHDFGEITHGDVPTHWKTKNHEERERIAAKMIFANFPSPLYKNGYRSWNDYESQKSREACFAYALDKVEPLFELMNPINARSMKRLRFTLEDHLAKKIPATKDFPVMRKFVDVVTREMVKNDIFWQNDKR